MLEDSTESLVENIQFVNDPWRASIVDCDSLRAISDTSQAIEEQILHTILPPSAVQVLPVVMPIPQISIKRKFRSSSWRWPEALIRPSASRLLGGRSAECTVSWASVTFSILNCCLFVMSRRCRVGVGAVVAAQGTGSQALQALKVCRSEPRVRRIRRYRLLLRDRSFYPWDPRVWTLRMFKTTRCRRHDRKGTPRRNEGESTTPCGKVQ